jgi:hypothetical protein
MGRLTCFWVGLAMEDSVCSRIDFISFRRSLLAVLGVSALACGPGIPPGQPDSGTDSNDSDSLTSLTGLSLSNTGPTGGGSESSSAGEDSTTWECQGYTETTTETLCQPPPAGTTTASTGGSDGSDTDVGSTGGESGSLTTSAGTLTAGDTDTDGGLCDAYVGTLPIDFYYDTLIESIGPYEQDGMCCWDVTYEQMYPCGRPFLIDAVPRVATVREREDWSDRDRPDLDDLDDHTRMLLAGAWLEDALAEHASIAAFARFALQLLALGAPPDLIADTHRAIADELEHARLCFTLASAYADREIGPGALAMGGALTDDIDLASVVVAAIREGCIGETMAAMQAEVARGLAQDPIVVASLDRIAADESRHAALAWRFVDWAVKQGGRRIRDVAADAFIRYAPNGAGNTRSPSPDLTAHGRISASDLALLQRRTYDEVIRPCAAAVLSMQAERGDHVLM